MLIRASDRSGVLDSELHHRSDLGELSVTEVPCKNLEVFPLGLVKFSGKNLPASYLMLPILRFWGILWYKLDWFSSSPTASLGFSFLDSVICPYSSNWEVKKNKKQKTKAQTKVVLWWEVKFCIWHLIFISERSETWKEDANNQLKLKLSTS